MTCKPWLINHWKHSVSLEISGHKIVWNWLIFYCEKLSYSKWTEKNFLDYLEFKLSRILWSLNFVKTQRDILYLVLGSPKIYSQLSLHLWDHFTFAKIAWEENHRKLNVFLFEKSTVNCKESQKDSKCLILNFAINQANHST